MTLRSSAGREYLPLILFCGAATALTMAASGDPFFWDTVQLASKHAHFFYERGGAWALLPPDMDSGHPPLLGYYLATVWAIFGKSLAASHWSMLPFLWMIVLHLYRLGRRLGGTEWAYWILPLALLDPVLLGQSVLVSPDTILAAFFLCALDGIWNRRRLLLMLGIIGLCLVSMRGMMCSGALLVGLFLVRRNEFWKTWYYFLPGFALAAAFLIWHFRAAGWIGYHAGSPWAPAFEQAGLREMLRNAAVLAWRWLDFGRWAEWLAVGTLLWLAYRERKNGTPFRWPFERSFFVLLLCLVLLLSMSALRYHNLSAHRYFLPLFLIFHLFVFQWIVKTNTFRTQRKKIWLTLLSVSMAAGNFQVYPHGISMDWDSTLAHLPYHDVRADAVAFLKREQIPLSAVGAAFPNLSSQEYLLLEGDSTRFAAINAGKNDYVFISNVFNDISKEARLEWQQNGILLWQQRRGPVWGEIYTKKENSSFPAQPR